MIELIKKYALEIIATIIAICATVYFGYTVYKYFHPPEPVHSITQYEAESVAGVKESANASQTPLDNTQATEIAKEIHYIYTENKEPTHVVETTGDKVETVVKKEQESLGADFTIVTDKNNPDESVELDKLTQDDKVELNQYNVFAYKKVLRQVEVGRSIDGDVVVGASVHKKITNDGQYVGIGADYDTDKHKAMVKVVYTW